MNYRKKGGADGEMGDRVSLGWHEGREREVCSGGCEAGQRMDAGGVRLQMGEQVPTHT